MSSAQLNNKHTLWSILTKYDRIEVPIIQRDYAQGRKSAKTVRKDILDYIITAIVNGQPVELDFVYGVVHSFQRDGVEKKAFIPIDGQQRLTTLWLLHWYLAYAAGLLEDPENGYTQFLNRFTYETRPSSKDFLEHLCTQKIGHENGIREEIIENSNWFDEAWKLDPSIMGFITMLETIQQHEKIKEADTAALLQSLIEKELVSFYFLELDKFGLGEEIYTRMNARGKILTDFEKFKSNFFKIIDKSPLRKHIETKIEYDWVNNLWDYRPSETFVTDEPFMKWLRFVTQMLYVQRLDKNTSSKENVDYLSSEILSEIYSSEDNLKFLVHAFDTIPQLLKDNLSFSLEWNSDKGLAKAFKWIVTDFSTTDVIRQLVIYAALLYLEKLDNMDNLDTFLRVIRNLIENTPDRSVREWPSMIDSIRKLISTDIYQTLCTEDLSLKGFRSEQVEIEIFKARMIQHRKEAFDLIQQTDEHPALRGRLGNLIIELQEPRITAKFTLQLKDIRPEDIDLKELEKIFRAYSLLYQKDESSDDDFSEIWGNLLPTSIYRYNDNVCWWDCGKDNYITYENHPIMMKLARQVAKNNNRLDDTLIQNQKKFIINQLSKCDGNLSTITNVKDQLYLLYIISTRLLDMNWSQFFKEDRLNFGWIGRETGYSTPFTNNRIYQTYPKRFRSDSGIVGYRTPDIHKANSRGKNIFERLILWAQS